MTFPGKPEYCDFKDGSKLFYRSSQHKCAVQRKPPGTIYTLYEDGHKKQKNTASSSVSSIHLLELLIMVIICGLFVVWTFAVVGWWCGCRERSDPEIHLNQVLTLKADFNIGLIIGSPADEKLHGFLLSGAGCSVSPTRSGRALGSGSLCLWCLCAAFVSSW